MATPARLGDRGAGDRAEPALGEELGAGLQQPSGGSRAAVSCARWEGVSVEAEHF